MNRRWFLVTLTCLLSATLLTGCSGKSVEGKWIVTQSGDMNEVGSEVLFTEDGWMDYGGDRYQYEQTNETTLELKGMLSQAVQLDWRDDGTFSFNGLTLAPPDSKEAKGALTTKAQIEEQKRAEEEAQRKAEHEAATAQQCQERLGMDYATGVKKSWGEIGGSGWDGQAHNYFAVVYTRLGNGASPPKGWQDKVNAELKKTAGSITTYEQLVQFLQTTKGSDGKSLLPESDYTCPADGDITLEWKDGGHFEGSYEPVLHCSIHSPKE